MTDQNTDKEIITSIRDKAIEVFADKGYDATKITDITDLLSISRGPIYYYFHDKFGLYTAAYNYFEERLQRIHQEIFSSALPPLDKLEEQLYLFIQHISIFGINFFHRIEDIPELHEISLRYNALNQEFYIDNVQMVKDAQKEGLLLDTMPPEEVVHFTYLIYLGLLHGIHHKLLEKNNPEELKKWIAFQMTLLREKLLP